MPVHRVEVRPRPGQRDPRGEAARRDAAGLPQAPSRIETAAVYLIEGDLSEQQLDRLADTLLADPVLETAGPSSRRDMWRAALPMAILSKLSGLFPFLSQEHRGAAAMAVSTVAMGVVVVVLIVLL